MKLPFFSSIAPALLILAGCSSTSATTHVGADGGCGGSQHTPGSKCVEPARLHFDPKNSGLEAELAALGVDFAPPTDGFQIVTQGIQLLAGEDDEWCEAFAVPEDPATPGREYCVDRVEIAMSDGFHHLFVSKAPPGSKSEGLMEVGKRVRCVGGAHVTYGTDLEPIPLAQGTYVDGRFWTGVGVKVTAGQKISVNYHWLNTTDQSQIAITKLNFHAASCSGMAELRQFGFYDQSIDIPPSGRYATSMQATFTQDVYVLDIFRHTHRFGTEVPISYYLGLKDGQSIYVSPDYHSGASFQFPAPVLFHKGEGIQFTCNYENPTAKPIKFGPTADDEMCMLLGTWWLVDQTQTPEVQHRYKW